MVSTCFYVWNEYQLASFSSLIEFLNGYIAIEDRGYNKDFVVAAQKRYKETDRCLTIVRGKNISIIDKFDIIVAHTAFLGIGQISHAKLIFVQYGLAKEKYNYGLWRGLADVNFVFGEYSKKKISPVSNAIEVGHPFLSVLQRKQLVECNSSEASTIYYAPTWGEHSSLESTICDLQCLSEDFRVILAPHHNTFIFSPYLLKSIPSSIEIVIDQESRISSLLKSDIVVSDYSGIIFDAFYLGKKVAVIRNQKIQAVSQKIDFHSIEHREIDRFAVIVESILDVRLLKEEQFPTLKSHPNYYSSLICNIQDADKVLAENLSDLKYSDQYEDLRRKIRSHWDSVELEKEKLRSQLIECNSGLCKKLITSLRQRLWKLL